MKLFTIASFMAGSLCILAVFLLAGCHNHASHAHLIVPPECAHVACTTDIEIRDGKAYCKHWQLKVSCTQVQK